LPFKLVESEVAFALLGLVLMEVFIF